MDTSETYIKMRRKAIPDLGKGIPIKYPCNYQGGAVWTDSKGDWYFSTEAESFQLERPDQLQEMVFDFDNDPDTERAKQITKFYHFWMQPYRQKFTSMEQLWVAFYMSEKFNKVWLNEKWELLNDK